jgi:hypothetical protein
MFAQESSLHTYHTENGYKITNVTIYNIFTEYYLYKRLSQTLSEALQEKDTITTQAINWCLEHHIEVLQFFFSI